MASVQIEPRRLKAGQEVTVKTVKGATIIGTVESNNSFAWQVEFEDGLVVPYGLIRQATIQSDPRWDKPGVYVYYSMGVDDDGHMTKFPNLIMRTENYGWYRIGNAGLTTELISPSEVPFTEMVPLTIHPDYINKGE